MSWCGGNIRAAMREAKGKKGSGRNDRGFGFKFYRGLI